MNLSSQVSSFFQNSLRAMKSRNYRLFFFGQGISLIGTWIQRVAMSWLVYRITNSAMLLGTVEFVGMLPTFLLAPFTGVLADRWNRHTMMLGTQIGFTLSALALGLLVVTEIVQVWHILVLSAISGIVMAFDVPARQSLVVDMVEDKRDLGNAIALNSTMFNGARLVGPSIAGLVIAAFGEWICFFINAATFVAVIAALLAMKIAPRTMNGTHRKVLVELKEGAVYAYRTVPIRATLILMAFVSVVGMSYMTLLPVFAKDVLRGGPDTLGFLMAITGVGAVGGAFYLASRKDNLTIDWQIPASLMLLGLGLLALGGSRMVWLSYAIVLVTGFAQMVIIASSNTVIQTVVDEDKRGRVMSLYAMAFMGMAPFGSLYAGTSAKLFTAPVAVIASGVLCVFGAALFTVRLPSLRKMTAVPA
ncbi:MAG TPA: MFS transporter [Candidatus Latescibacteria bacterium]|nr:MFS transporter [Candidatus Latescibacterota bacterium]